MNNKASIFARYILAFVPSGGAWTTGRELIIKMQF